MPSSRDADEPRRGVPDEIREGVRQGIRDALASELDRTSPRTAARLAAAGALGLAGAVGAVLLFSQSSHIDHVWHLALCAAVWTGLLVECFALVLLRIRLRRLPLAHGAALALLGLGFAAALGFVCPSPDYLEWWTSTAVGELAVSHAGLSGSALCLGLCSALAVGIGASLILALRGTGIPGVHVAAILLFLTLWPAVVLQSIGSPRSVFALWSLGLALGTYGGVTLGLLTGRRRARASR